MTACHPNPFRTERLARKAAWLRANNGKHVQPYHCDTCGGWHLAADVTAAIVRRPPTTGT